jgi:hypothetical protein
MARQASYRNCRRPASVREADNRKQIEFRQRRLALIGAIKLERGCMDCGYRAHVEALDFDHRPGEEKLFNIGNDPRRLWAAILAEIEKCDVVCANCHRVRTAERRT